MVLGFPHYMESSNLFVTQRKSEVVGSHGSLGTQGLGQKQRVLPNAIISMYLLEELPKNYSQQRLPK